MYCIKCGAQNEDNSKFCTTCGESLLSMSDPIPVVEPVTADESASLSETENFSKVESVVDPVAFAEAELEAEAVSFEGLEPALEDIPVDELRWDDLSEDPEALLSNETVEPVAAAEMPEPYASTVSAYGGDLGVAAFPVAEDIPEPMDEYADSDGVDGSAPVAAPAYVIAEPVDLSPRSVGEIRNDFSEAEVQGRTKKNKKTKEKGERKKWLLPLILSIVGVLLVAAVVVVGILTSWFGLAANKDNKKPAVEGPFGKLISSFDDVINAESFTVTMSLSGAGSEDIPETVSRYFLNDEDVELTMISSCGDTVTLFEKNTVYVYSGYRSSMTEYDAEELLKVLFDIRSGEEVSWKGAVKALGLEEYIKAKKADDLIELLKEEYLSNEKWLEKKLGFDKSIDAYTFDFGFCAFLEALVDVAEEADALNGKKADIIKAVSEIEDRNIKITVKLKDGKAAYVEFTVSTEDQKRTIKMTFSDINKTELKKNETEDIIENVEKEIEEFEKQTCVWCGGKKELSLKDDVFVCSDCMAGTDYGKCEGCGEKTNLKSFCGYYLCLECYGPQTEAEIPSDAKCYWCKTRNEISDVDGDGEYLCASCKENISKGKCTLCKTKTDLNTIKDKKYCHTCYAAVKSGDYKKGLYGECDYCGTVGEIAEYEDSGKSLCPECMEKYKVCPKCLAFYEEEYCSECSCDLCGADAALTKRGGLFVCEDCLSESIECPNCEGIYTGDHCETCYPDPCELCGEYTELSEVEDHMLCEECSDDCEFCDDCGEPYLGTYCPVCNDTPCNWCGEYGVLHTYGDYELCDDCYGNCVLCYDCGSLYQGSYCPICNDTPCYICGTNGEMYEANGHGLCYDCYYSYEICIKCYGMYVGSYCPNCPCEMCGTYAELTAYGSHYICLDCYYSYNLCSNCGGLYSGSYCSYCYDVYCYNCGAYGYGYYYNGYALCGTCCNNAYTCNKCGGLAIGYCPNCPCYLCNSYEPLTEYCGYYMCDDCYWDCSYCSNCGGVYIGDHCSCYNNTCYNCGAYGYSYNVNGHALCENCYYSANVCYNCGEIYFNQYGCPNCSNDTTYNEYCYVCGSSYVTYEYYGYDLCASCYETHWYCTNCGILHEGVDCPYCSGGTASEYCYICGSYASYDYNGYKLCTTCYWDYWYCYNCGNLYTGSYCTYCYGTETYYSDDACCYICGSANIEHYYGGHDLCESCFSKYWYCTNCDYLHEGVTCPNCGN